MKRQIIVKWFKHPRFYLIWGIYDGIHNGGFAVGFFSVTWSGPNLAILTIPVPASIHGSGYLLHLRF